MWVYGCAGIHTATRGTRGTRGTRARAMDRGYVYLAGLVEQNISRHEHRVGKEAYPYAITLLNGFLFELDHAFEPTHRSLRAQQPAKL